ncbi:MAG: hypothetical protein AB7P04_06610 [Bacteriovoracia bacterium]
MDLNYDWKSFQDVFYPHRRAGNTQSRGTADPILCIADGSRVRKAFSQSDDLTEWTGRLLEEFRANFSNRKLHVFGADEVTQWLRDASRPQAPLSLAHYYDQLEFLKSRAFPAYSIAHLTPDRDQRRDQERERKRARSTGREVFDTLGARHFLLQAVQGWWGKILPSSYALYLRITHQGEDSDFILIVRRGRLETFHRPNLEALGAEKSRIPADVVKYLSEKYVLPVQGIFVGAEQWRKWSETPDPWREIAASVRAEEVKLVPFRWSLATLVATKAFLGV